LWPAAVFERDHLEAAVRHVRRLPGLGPVWAHSLDFAIDYTDNAMNLRCYYPDFVAVGADGTHWLLETKGQESPEVPFKDRAATEWCENATSLTGVAWRYRKVPQGAFEALRPAALADLAALG
jgi:type III restriction enzyme